jgi:hypothetical protein
MTQPAPPIVSTESKPGVRTTEFWVAMAAGLVQMVNLVGIWDFVPNKYSTIILGVIAGLYALSRGIAKQGVAFQGTADGQPLTMGRRRRANR